MGGMLLGLCLSGFVSATLLPGTSEAVFAAFLWHYPSGWGIGLMLVTIANSLGSLTSYLLTRFLPRPNRCANAVHKLQKYGTPLLFFSFLPIVGDGFPLAAGWLKLPIGPSIFFIALGKLFRYSVLVLGYFALL